MAVNLTNTWKQHAFPDDAPGREERWSLDSERRRVADRTDFDLEQSGSTNKIRRFTSGRNDELNGKTAKEKADDDIMMLAVGSPAYMRAYNTRLTFKINGDDFEVTQGELHDRAKQRAEDLRRQIDAAKQQGASADDIARLQTNLDAYRIIRDNADPRLGKVTPDRRQAIHNAINGNPAVRDALLREDNAIGAPATSRMDQDADSLGVVEGLGQSQGKASFAAEIDQARPALQSLSLSAEFLSAKMREVPESDPLRGEQAEPLAPGQGTGLSL